MLPTTAVSREDALDIFEELPERVQVAFVSLLHRFRSNPHPSWPDYPLHVADVLQGSGLVAAKIDRDHTTSGPEGLHVSARFTMTAITRELRDNIGLVLRRMTQFKDDYVLSNEEAAVKIGTQVVAQVDITRRMLLVNGGNEVVVPAGTRGAVDFVTTAHPNIIVAFEQCGVWALDPAWVTAVEAATE